MRSTSNTRLDYARLKQYCMLVYASTSKTRAIARTVLDNSLVKSSQVKSSQVKSSQVKRLEYCLLSMHTCEARTILDQASAKVRLR